MAVTDLEKETLLNLICPNFSFYFPNFNNLFVKKIIYLNNHWISTQKYASFELIIPTNYLTFTLNENCLDETTLIYIIISLAVDGRPK